MDSPSKMALEQLAKSLVTRFPNLGDPGLADYGWRMWFQHTSSGKAATGFLEERLKNQRKRLSKKKPKDDRTFNSQSARFLKWDSENEEDDPEPDHKTLEYLRHNFGLGTSEKMTETVFQRRTIIRRHMCTVIPGFDKIPTIMPRLFDTEGMIVQDFNLRHPNLSLIVYERWPKASKLLFQYAEESAISYTKTMKVSKLRKNLTDDDISVLAYAMLPYILPSCGRKLKGMDEEGADEGDEMHARKKKRKTHTIKASDLDSEKSLIMFKPKNTNIVEVIHENSSPAPFILALKTE